MISMIAVCVILLLGLSGADREMEIIHKGGVIFEEIGEINFGDSSWTIVTSIDLALAAPLLDKLVDFHDSQFKIAEKNALNSADRFKKSASRMHVLLTTMADQLDVMIERLWSTTMGGSTFSIKRPERRFSF